MGEWLLSRRDRPIVTMHEVPGCDAGRAPVPEGRPKSFSIPQTFFVQTEPRHEQAIARRMLHAASETLVQSSRWDEVFSS